MQITAAVLRALSTGFKTNFLQGIDAVSPTWQLVAMEVNSSAKLENYGWLKAISGVREWVGERVINNLEANVYQLTNRDWEHTLGVKRNDIEDDTLGLYANLFAMQGEAVAAHPDQLIWQTLLGGFSSKGLDGQYFFDTDHVAYDASGNETSYSNYASGSGAPWFLMDLSRKYMKPLVMQWRQKPKFISKIREDDDNVFFSKEYLYGMDARYAAGYGFHQLAYAGKATLDATAYAAALVAMGTQLRPDGASLNVQPTHLVVGPSNLAAAKTLIAKEYLAGGENNIWYKSVELVTVPALG